MFGSREPRFRSVPPAAASLGAEAVDFTAKSGLILDPWQGDVLSGSLGIGPGGKWAARNVGVLVPRQNGKGDQALDTPILTGAGWSAMGSLQPEDLVLGSSGRFTRVVACSPVYTDSVCYEVSFTDGAAYIVGSGHLWPVWDKESAGVREVATDHLASRFGRVRPGNGRNEYRYRVRCDTVPQLPEADLPIDPYLLGFWLGDGTSKAANITVGAQDREWVAERLAAVGADVIRVSEHDHGHAWGLHFRLDAAIRDGFEARCRRLGVWGDKHIPDLYLTAAPAQRLALLQGLMDSDGSIVCTNRSPQVEFSSSYPRLAASFQELARSLGVRVTLKVKGTSRRDSSRFLWTPTFNPFQMPRKAARYAPPTSQRAQWMSITGVRRVPTVPTRCIQVANADGVYLTGRLFTPTHNSILEARELVGLFLLNEGLIIHSAHKFDTSQEHFRRMQALIEANPDLDRHVRAVTKATGKEAIELRNGSRLMFKARTISGSGRGFSSDLLVLDEAMYLPEEAASAMGPTMMARPNPQTWYTSSAGMPNSAVLWRLVQRGRAGDPRMAYFEWGAPSDADSSDPAVWAAANPALGLRLSEEELEQELALLTVEDFAREHLGMWDEAGNSGSFPAGCWDSARDTGSRPSEGVCYAVEVAEDRSWACVAAAGAVPAGFHGEIGRYGRGTAWVGDFLADLARRRRDVRVVVQPTSPAGSLLTELRDKNVPLVEVSTGEYAQACGALFDLVVEGQFRHLGQAALDVAVREARRKPSGDAWVWNRRTPTVDISPLVAVTLAVWGASRPVKRPGRFMTF